MKDTAMKLKSPFLDLGQLFLDDLIYMFCVVFVRTFSVLFSPNTDVRAREYRMAVELFEI